MPCNCGGSQQAAQKTPHRVVGERPSAKPIARRTNGPDGRGYFWNGPPAPANKQP